ncbi:MAG: type I restriction-modification system subunit M N-terminal domain-containing protein [Oscillospiraceae bacterium]
MSNLTGFVKRLRDIMRNDAGINGDAQRIEQIAWMLFLKVYDAKEQDWEWDERAISPLSRKNAGGGIGRWMINPALPSPETSFWISSTILCFPSSKARI